MVMDIWIDWAMVINDTWIDRELGYATQSSMYVCIGKQSYKQKKRRLCDRVSGLAARVQESLSTLETQGLLQSFQICHQAVENTTNKKPARIDHYNDTPLDVAISPKHQE